MQQTSSMIESYSNNVLYFDLPANFVVWDVIGAEWMGEFSAIEWEKSLSMSS